MPGKGYDDRPTILRVEALMTDSPGISRHAAIKSVVGDNRSNIRRIEQKMSQASKAVPERISSKDAIPASWNWDPSSHERALRAWRNPRPDFGALRASFTRGDRLVAGACAGLLAVSLIGIAGQAAVEALLWASRLEIGVASLLGASIPQHAAGPGAHADVGFGAIHAMRSAAGAAAYPWVAGLLVMAILAVVLYQSLPHRCGWGIRLAVPGAIGSLVGLGALLPAMTDFCAAFGVALAWWAMTKSHALYELPISLPRMEYWPRDHLPSGRPGIFIFGNSQAEVA